MNAYPDNDNIWSDENKQYLNEFNNNSNLEIYIIYENLDTGEKYPICWKNK